MLDDLQSRSGESCRDGLGLPRTGRRTLIDAPLIKMESLYTHGRGALRRELTAYLRTAWAQRRLGPTAHAGDRPAPG